MSDVVSIRFKTCGKIYDFASDGIEIAEGDLVVVESDFGLNIAKVMRVLPSGASAADRELKHVLRKATAEDLQQREQNKSLEQEARLYCTERVMARGLPMKLIATESTLDRKRVVFYFTAEGRIDFRELVKDLAAKFKTRIEMRQIGVRDEAKLVGGLGACGRELCCKTFLTSFEPISIRMAKKQEMVLNVGKLSGLCSRLMCCLRYEYDAKGQPAPETAAIDVEPHHETPAPVMETVEALRPPPEKRDRREEKRMPALRPPQPPAEAAVPLSEEPPDFGPEPEEDAAEEESPAIVDPAAAAQQTDENKQRGRRRPRRRRRNKK